MSPKTIVTKNAVIPAAAGVDVGCEMAAVEVPFSRDRLEGKVNSWEK